MAIIGQGTPSNRLKLSGAADLVSMDSRAVAASVHPESEAIRVHPEGTEGLP